MIQAVKLDEMKQDQTKLVPENWAHLSPEIGEQSVKQKLLAEVCVNFAKPGRRE